MKRVFDTIWVLFEDCPRPLSYPTPWKPYRLLTFRRDCSYGPSSDTDGGIQTSPTPLVHRCTVGPGSCRILVAVSGRTGIGRTRSGLGGTVVRGDGDRTSGKSIRPSLRTDSSTLSHSFRSLVHDRRNTKRKVLFSLKIT